MGYITKEQIFQVDDIVTEDVDVPEWGGMVRVRGMTGHQRDDFETSIVEANKAPVLPGQQSASVGTRARLAARCIVDEDGRRMFSAEDAGILGLKSAAALDRIFDVACRLSRIKTSDVDDSAEDMLNHPFVNSSLEWPSTSE